MIKIVTLLGSARTPSHTANALALVRAELSTLEGVDIEHIELASLSLAIPGVEIADSQARWLQETIQNAHGLILATPEYHGSFSSLLKLSIENLGFPSALSGKPVSLLGVAGGKLGATKSIEHLRSVCAHVGALVLPGSFSIANSRSVFDPQGNCLDPEIEKSLRSLGCKLVKYIRETACPETSYEAMVRAG